MASATAETQTTAASNGKAPRTKDPQYIVFKKSSGATWDQLTPDPIKATSRKQAIVEATKHMDNQASQEGMFLVIPAEQFQPLKRAIAVETINQFS